MQRTTILLANVCPQPIAYGKEERLTRNSGPPPGQPALISRLLDAEYYGRQCQNFFPTEHGKTFASSQGKTEIQVNDHTGGWETRASTRLLYSNGEYDPWRSASVSSTFRPGGPLNGTDSVPVILINGSRHCNDLSLSNAVNPAVAAAQQAEISQISDWVAEFYAAKSTGGSNNTISSLPTNEGSRLQGDHHLSMALVGIMALWFLLL